MQLLVPEASADYYTRPPGSISLLMLRITYIQAMALHSHTQGRFNNHTVHIIACIGSWMDMTTSVMSAMKIGNTVPRVGIEPIYVAFRASVLPNTPCRLPDVTTIPKLTCLCSFLPERSMQTTTMSRLSSDNTS